MQMLSIRFESNSLNVSKQTLLLAKTVTKVENESN